MYKLDFSIKTTYKPFKIRPDPHFNPISFHFLGGISIASLSMNSSGVKIG
jgi:hypothetical protein